MSDKHVETTELCMSISRTQINSTSFRNFRRNLSQSAQILGEGSVNTEHLVFTRSYGMYVILIST